MGKTMYVEKSVDIHCDVQMVFEYLKYTRNQQNFSVWSMRDSNQKVTEIGDEGMVGHIYSWDSEIENVGSGKQKIVNLVPDQEIEYDITFERPMPSKAVSKLKTDKLGDNKTKVTWSFESELDDSMASQAAEMESQVGAEVQESLGNLKNILESA